MTAIPFNSRDGRTVHQEEMTKNFAQRTIRFMDRIRDTYDFAALNTHHFPFEKIHEAFDVAIHDKENAFKVILIY